VPFAWHAATTGRARIIKFEGCYHGHADALLVKAGSGALTLGNPSSAGVPPETTVNTLVLEYNNTAMLEAVFARDGASIAGVIVEPVAGNMNLVAPRDDFLAALRTLCTRHGALLIFDEVMTGFRVGPQGAQGRYGITADLITLGKIVGGGMPLGAFGGRRDIMQCVAPLGPVYQAGTLSGNPVAVAAGLATLKQIERGDFFERLAATTQALTAGLSAAARDYGIAFCCQSIGGMFGIYFRATPPASYAEVMQCDAPAFNRFFHAMLDNRAFTSRRRPSKRVLCRLRTAARRSRRRSPPRGIISPVWPEWNRAAIEPDELPAAAPTSVSVILPCTLTAP
jgi:glutamate-1-semialdehyde 2,1-aminomutase